MPIVCYIHIFITNYLLHVSVFITPSSGRPFRYLFKSYKLFAKLLHRLCYKMLNIPCFYKFTMLLQYLKQNYFVLLYPKNLKNISEDFYLQHINICILKMLVKILKCSTLECVCSCYLLCTLATYVFIVSSRAWVRNDVEILRGHSSIIKYKSSFILFHCLSEHNLNNNTAKSI
jgi:hypothetical protein